MGEDPRYVFNTGSLDVELASRVEHDDHQRARQRATASATTSTSTRPFLMVDAASGDDRAPTTARHLETTLQGGGGARACRRSGSGRIPDAGTGEMADSLRHFREQHAAADRARCGSSPTCRPNEFVALLKRTRLPGRQFVGRHQGVLVSRHAGRQHRRRGSRAACTPSNVAHVGYDARRDSRRRRRRRSRTAATRRRTIYYQPDASQTIVDVLAERRALHPEAVLRRAAFEDSQRSRETHEDMTDSTHIDHRRRARSAAARPASSSPKPASTTTATRRWPRSWWMRRPRPAPTRSSSRRIFPSTRCCAAARRPHTSANRCSIC